MAADDCIDEMTPARRRRRATRTWRSRSGARATCPTAGAQSEPDAELDLSGDRWLLNPGSVGQPRDGDPRASWMLLELELVEGHLAPHRVPDRRGRGRDPRGRVCRRNWPTGFTTANDEERANPRPSRRRGRVRLRSPAAATTTSASRSRRRRPQALDAAARRSRSSTSRTDELRRGRHGGRSGPRTTVDTLDDDGVGAGRPGRARRRRRQPERPRRAGLRARARSRSRRRPETTPEETEPRDDHPSRRRRSRSPSRPRRSRRRPCPSPRRSPTRTTAAGQFGPGGVPPGQAKKRRPRTDGDSHRRRRSLPARAQARRGRHVHRLPGARHACSSGAWP